MNAQSLRGLIDQLIAAEAQFEVQARLDELAAQLQQLMASPQDQTLQLQYSKTLERLRLAAGELANTFTPGQRKSVEEIGADKYFLADLPEELRKLTADNPLTPAVVSAHLVKVIKARSAFLETLKALQDRLGKIGISAAVPAEGTAEIGILIPRPMFGNHLDEFAKELSVLNNVIRVFSELVTCSPKVPSL